MFLYNLKRENRMKKIIAIVLFCFLLLNLWAFGSKEKVDYSVESFTRQITKQLERDIFDYEKNIIEATYLYYYMKYDKVWDSEKWTAAKQTAIRLCFNDAAIIASKAGIFGEKFIQAFIVTAGDAKDNFDDWLEKNSARYKEEY